MQQHSDSISVTSDGISRYALSAILHKSLLQSDLCRTLLAGMIAALLPAKSTSLPSMSPSLRVLASLATTLVVAPSPGIAQHGPLNPKLSPAPNAQTDSAEMAARL